MWWLVDPLLLLLGEGLRHAICSAPAGSSSHSLHPRPILPLQGPRVAMAVHSSREFMASAVPLPHPTPERPALFHVRVPTNPHAMVPAACHPMLCLGFWWGQAINIHSAIEFSVPSLGASRGARWSG